MLERIHEHIVSELGHSSRTDTMFIVVAVVFNLIVLAVNSAASSSRNDLGEDIILGVFIVMTLLVNGIALSGLYVGRKTRGKLLGGLISMYVDNQVDKYYDKSLVSNYGTRYLLFGAVICILALTAIVVPLIIRIF
jgi:hypothetical protein